MFISENYCYWNNVVVRILLVLYKEVYLQNMVKH